MRKIIPDNKQKNRRICRKSRVAKFGFVSGKKQSYCIALGQKYSCGKKSAFFGKCRTFQESITTKRREMIMSNRNNQINVPQAKQAMEQFKMQAAQEVGVNLQNGYNGHLTSREAGSVGGQMVKKMIEAYEQGMQ